MSVVARKKPSLAVLIGMGKPKGDAPEEEDDESKDEGGDVDEAKDSAVEKMVDALGLNPDKVDKAQFGDGLRLYMQLCDKDEGGDEEEDY